MTKRKTSYHQQSRHNYNVEQSKPLIVAGVSALTDYFVLENKNIGYCVLYGVAVGAGVGLGELVADTAIDKEHHKSYFTEHTQRLMVEMAFTVATVSLVKMGLMVRDNRNPAKEMYRFVEGVLGNISRLPQSESIFNAWDIVNAPINTQGAVVVPQNAVGTGIYSQGIFNSVTKAVLTGVSANLTGSGVVRLLDDMY